MDYKELIDILRTTASTRESSCYECSDCLKAAAAIETLLAERDAAVRDLTLVCEDNPDVCQFCKHVPCTESYGRCIGWKWRGPIPIESTERTEE